MQSIRTNSDIGGWHHTLNRRAAGRCGLPLYVFVALLHKEAGLVSVQIHLVSERKLKRMQRATYREVQRRLFELWEAFGPLTLFKSINNITNKITHHTLRMRALHLNRFNKFLTQKLQKLCHNFLGTNRPKGWARTDRKWVRNALAWVPNVWVRNVHGYDWIPTPRKRLLRRLVCSGPFWFVPVIPVSSSQFIPFRCLTPLRAQPAGTAREGSGSRLDDTQENHVILKSSSLK